ncbi:MAG: hypothetical protein ACLP9L_15990 [Thermoguttaceae bacterium]
MCRMRYGQPGRRPRPYVPMATHPEHQPEQWEEESREAEEPIAAGGGPLTAIVTACTERMWLGPHRPPGRIR